MKLHPSVEKIKKLLLSHHLDFKYFEHPPVRTSEEADALRPEYSLSQGAKSLILRVKDQTGKHFIMVVIPGDKKFSSEKLKQQLSIKDLRFALEEEVLEITNGVLSGGVPPFGKLFNLETIVDPSLFDNEIIIFNCGDRCASISMKSADYQTLIQPRVMEII